MQKKTLHTEVENLADKLLEVAQEYDLAIAIPAICVVLCNATQSDHDENQVPPALTFEMVSGMLGDLNQDITGRSMEESLSVLNHDQPVLH